MGRGKREGVLCEKDMKCLKWEGNGRCGVKGGGKVV